MKPPNLPSTGGEPAAPKPVIDLPDVALRRALNASVLRAVRPLSFGLAAFYAALALLLILGTLPAAAQSVMFYPWAVSAIALTVVGLASRRRGFRSDWAHGSFAVMLGFVFINSGILMRTGGPPALSVVFVLIMLGSAIIVLSRIFYVLVLSASLATWGVATWQLWPIGEWSMWLIVLVATGIIGFAAQTSRERTLVRLERARYNAQRLAAVVEASHDAIVSIAVDGTILTWNKGATALYGYSPDDVIGRNAEFLFPPNYRAELQFFLDRLGRGATAAVPETYRRAANGDLIPVAVSLAPIRDSSGEVIGGSSIAVDLRPRKKLDEEKSAVIRREADLRASQQLSRLKTDFINVAAHELYTPLTPIKMRLHELRRIVKGEEGNQALATLQRNVDRLQSVVDEIVRVAQVQGTQIVAKLEPTGIEELVQEVVAEHQSRAAERKQTLRYVADGRTTVRADAHRLQDAIANLVDNAIKFTPSEGTIEIQIYRKEQEVVVAVKDSGRGMEPQRISRIFQDPSVVEDHHRRTEPGWGFGLFVSRRIIEAHQGRIWVESEGIGKGSTFFVALPIAKAA